MVYDTLLLENQGKLEQLVQGFYIIMYSFSLNNCIMYFDFYSSENGEGGVV